MSKGNRLSIISTVFLVIFCILAASGPAGAALTDGLVLYLDFNEGSGTTAADSSGYGNNGALTGGYTWTTGRFGSALTFNGTNASVLVPTSTDTNLIQNAYSVAFWVKTTYSGAGSGFLFGGSTASNQHSGCIQVAGTGDGPSYAGKIGSEANPSGSYVWSTSTVNDGQWHQVVFTFSDNNTSATAATVYVDGSPQRSTLIPYSIYEWAPYHTIGNRASIYFSGSIDEFSIYSRELSGQEIAALFVAPPSAVPIPPACYMLGSGLLGLGFLRRKLFKA